MENKEKEVGILTVIEKESPALTSEKQEEPATEYISYAPIAGEGRIRFDYRQMIKDMAAVCIRSEKFQSLDPSTEMANRVRNYEDAKQGRFILTEAMDFARDYKEPKEPQDTHNTQPAPPSAVSSKKGFFSSILHPLRKDKGKDKEQEKGKERKKGENKKEKDKPKNKKEKVSLQQRLNKDLQEKFSSMEKEKEEETQAITSGMDFTVNQGPRTPVSNGSFFSDSRVRHPDAPPTSPSTLSNHRGGIVN